MAKQFSSPRQASGLAVAVQGWLEGTRESLQDRVGQKLLPPYLNVFSVWVVRQPPDFHKGVLGPRQQLQGKARQGG